MKGPLDGVLVLEFADYVTGPYAAVLLADFGARVIKIEAPGRGDPFRGWGEGGYSPTFRSVNRSKESITLNLRTDRGQEVAQQLASRADVFIENHRPGVAGRVGLGYEQLSELAPSLVYCSISGFGQDGPDRDRPGYDTIGQATAGLLGLLTDLDDPKGMGISLSDHLAGLFAANGILAALVERGHTGVGQRIETSLLQATVAFIGENAARYFDSSVVPDRKHRTRLAQVYAFVAGDGLPFVIHLSSPQKFFAGLAAAVSQPGLATDPRFAERESRVRNYDELNALLTGIFRGGPRKMWLDQLAAQDVPAAPINTLEEVFADPQVQALDMVREVVHPEAGRTRLVGGAVRFGEHIGAEGVAPPLLGEHNDAILHELGYDQQKIAELREEGLV